MRFVNVRHKGLKGLIERGDTRLIDSQYAKKIQYMITFLTLMSGEEELFALNRWRVHRLKGTREGTWSFSVSNNWRLTFDVDVSGAIRNLDLEDYHD